MSIKFTHINIVCKSCEVLAKFYQDVFECTPLSQPKEMVGSWINKGTGVKNARVKSLHLKLPGLDKSAPTIEISEYNPSEDKQNSLSNRIGFGHIAFCVDDVEATREKVLQSGGFNLGEISKHEFTGVGELTFIYMKDPEGNIVEIQKWKKLSE